MLKKLAKVVELCRQEANSQLATPARRSINFARAGQNINVARLSNTARLLRFPREIVETSLRPDIVIWSMASKTVLLVELTAQ